MTKSEVYSKVINAHKITGQGLPNITIKHTRPDVQNILDELVEEGSIRCTKIRILDEEHSFYYAKEGYSTMDNLDDLPSFMEIFLGVTEKIDNMNPITYYLRKPDYMRRYCDWLEKNKEQLDIMLNLDDYYNDETTFSEDEIKFFQSKSLIDYDKTIKECIKLCLEENGKNSEIISISNKLIKLYNEVNYPKEEIEKAKNDIKDHEIKYKLIKKLILYLKSLKPDNKKIKEVKSILII